MQRAEPIHQRTSGDRQRRAGGSTFVSALLGGGHVSGLQRLALVVGFLGLVIAIEKDRLELVRRRPDQTGGVAGRLVGVRRLGCVVLTGLSGRLAGAASPFFEVFLTPGRAGQQQRTQ